MSSLGLQTLCLDLLPPLSFFMPTNCFYLSFTVTSTELSWLSALSGFDVLPVLHSNRPSPSSALCSSAHVTLLFLFKDSFTFVFIRMGVLSTCSLHHMHARYPRRPERGTGSPGTGVNSCKPSCGCWSSGRKARALSLLSHLSTSPYLGHFLRVGTVDL